VENNKFTCKHAVVKEKHIKIEPGP